MSETVATLSVPITGDPRGLDAVLSKAQRQLEAFERRFGKGFELPAPKGGGADPFAPTTRGSQQARDSVLQLAQAQARLAAAEGDAAGAARILSAAINDTNRSTLQGIGAQTQLANLNTRITKEASGAGSAFERMSGGVSTLTTAIGALGIAGLVTSVVSAGVAAAQSANQLERTEAIMRQLSGSSQRYAEIVKLAEANQRLFGGSLNDNLTPLNALLQLSNRTGAELQNLNETSQLLLASAPGKAFEDASFALSEFLSNNGAEAALSLADQFNLNKQALAGLAAEGTSASERIAGLNALLAEQGVTAATLAAATSTNAATYAATGAAVDTLRTQLGALLAEGFAPVAAGAGDAATAVTGFITSLTGADSPMAQFQTRLAVMAGSYEEYRAAAERSAVGTQVIVDGLIAGIPILAPFSDQIAALAANMGILTQGEYEAAAGANTQAAATAGAVQTVETQAEATARLAAETAAATAASNEDALAKIRQGLEAEQAAQRQDALAQAIEAAAASSGSATAAAAAIAKQFSGVEAPAVLQLINLHRELAAARQQAESVKPNPVYQARTYGGSAPGDVARAQRASQESQQAMRQEKLRRLQQSYGGRFGLDPVPGTKGKGKGKGGGKSEGEKLAEKEAKAAAQLNEKLRHINERYYDQSTAAERDYQERLLSIQEEFAARRAEAEEAFADRQVENRLDFYKSLKNIDDQAVRQAASAEFEQFAQKAGAIAAEKGADVAKQYEDEAATIAAARAQRAEEIKKADEEAKTDKSKRGDAQYLRDLDKMERDAEQRRLDRIEQGKGSLKDEEAKALADAEAERQEKLADAATTAGDALAEAQRKTAEAAEKSNLALKDQVALLDQIRERGGIPGAGAAPTSPPTAAAAPADSTATAAAASTAATPAAVAGGPLPVTDAGLAAVVAKLDEVRRELGRLRPSSNYSPGA